MYIKKLLALALILCLGNGLLTGCSSDSDSQPSQRPETTPPPETKDKVAAGLAEISHEDALKIINETKADAVQAVLDNTPTVYSFINDENKESVAYVGQVFRQVLISDIKGFISQIERSGKYAGDADSAMKALNSYYAFKAEQKPNAVDAIWGQSRHGVKPKDINGLTLDTYEGAFYSSIYAKGTNLQKKIAGVDNPLRHKTLYGWSADDFEGVKIDADGDGIKTPDEFITAVFAALAKNAAEGQPFNAKNGSLDEEKVIRAGITESGLDLSQFVQKFLHGAVSFSQGAGDYLSVDLEAEGKGLNADNTQKFKDRPFSVLEHHWDEAFGYFGPARDYLSYTDEELAAQQSIDSFEDEKIVDGGDGFISLEREKNFGMSVNAGKRDKGATVETDFSAGIYDAFIRGRQLISKKPEGYMKYVQAYAVVASVEWEKVMAATAVHYINDVIADLEAYGTAEYSFKNLAKHFSEMKGFAFAFQFNPVSPMSLDKFKAMHEAMGDTPVLPGNSAATDAYIQNLLKARDIMQDAYQFDAENVRNW